MTNEAHLFDGFTLVFFIDISKVYGNLNAMYIDQRIILISLI